MLAASTQSRMFSVRLGAISHPILSGRQRQFHFVLLFLAFLQETCALEQDLDQLWELILVSWSLFYLNNLTVSLDSSWGSWVSQPTTDPLIFWPPSYFVDYDFDSPFAFPLPPDAYANISEPIVGGRSYILIFWNLIKLIYC